MLCLGHHRDTFQHVLAFNIVAPVLTSHVEFARDHGFDSLADSVEHQPRVLQVSILHAPHSEGHDREHNRMLDLWAHSEIH